MVKKNPGFRHDFPQQLLLLPQVAVFWHQHEEMLPEEEGGWEEASGVEGGEVEAVEELGGLALPPLPHEDVIEAVAVVVLDGHKIVLIPIPATLTYIRGSP